MGMDSGSDTQSDPEAGDRYSRPQIASRFDRQYVETEFENKIEDRQGIFWT
jgi:hypothetical protein